MRHFHLTKNKYFNPIINLDKLWTLVGEEVRALFTALAPILQHHLHNVTYQSS
jgi:large subunit ribosomal protein L27Ae